MSDALPEGWVKAALDEIAEINPRHPSDLDAALPVTFVPMPAISETIWTFQFTEERSLGEVRKGYTHFAEGDVLFAKITPCMENGKAAVATGLKNGIGCGSTELHVLRARGGIEPKFIYHFVHQETFRRDAAQSFTGTAGQLRVPVTFVREAEIPLPPLPEQRRIVAKLETLLGKVDACQKRLTKVPILLKRFRQSVLAAACSGRLTADWREENSISETSDDDRDIDLPGSWKSVEFGQLISDGPQNGLYKPSSFYGDGTFIVRIDAFYDGKITAWNELKRIRLTDKEQTQFALRDGDILINRVNSPKFLGKAALVRRLIEPCVYESNMMRLRLHCSRVQPDYAIIYLQSHQGLVELRKNAKHAINQSSINQEDVKSILFNLPPLPEQHEIVRRVEALFALADRTEARFVKAKAQVDRLASSLLAKAFRGELVPTEAALASAEGRDYEPASVLLKRIRAERASEGSASAPRCRPTRRTDNR